MSSGGFRRQFGFTLIAALIALVAITLAALALVRSVDTGVLIAGNQAFKEACIGAADVAIEAASGWLSGEAGIVGRLDQDNVAASYYATGKNACDMTGNRTRTDTTDDIDWDGSNSGNTNCQAKGIAVSGMPTGFAASYVITRLCDSPGSAAGGAAQCATDTLGGQSRFHGTADYAYRIQNEAEKARGTGQASAYYRIVARVVCPRSGASFVESIISMK